MSYKVVCNRLTNKRALVFCTTPRRSTAHRGMKEQTYRRVANPSASPHYHYTKGWRG
jgi:hypothetical protein